MVDAPGRGREFARAAGALFALVTSFAVVTCGGNSASQGPGGGSSDAGDGSSVGGGGVGGAGVGGGGTTSTGGCVSSKSECPDPGSLVGPSLCLTTDLFCATYTCDATLDDALVRLEPTCPSLTAPPTLTPLSVTRGCGYQTLGYNHSFGSEWQVFDDESGELVGAKFFSDTSYPPCFSSAYTTGTQFPICTDAVTCRVCVDDDPRAPRCRFDCDCDSIEPVADPCFGPETCECYCSELAATAGL